MTKIHFTTFEELEDKYLGKVGTPARDSYEQSVKAEIQAYHIGEAIKAARLRQELTQEELGAKMGVQRRKYQK